MNNEIFDTRIREKFEGVEPVFQEQDWQNFAPLLHPKIPFWIRARKPLAYAMAASTILFLTFQNYQQSIENKQLQADIQALTIEKQTVNTIVEHHTDTVFVLKDVMPSPNSTITELGKNNAVANTQTAQQQAILPTAKNEVKQNVLLGNKKQNISQDADNQIVENEKENAVSNLAFAKNEVKSESSATVSTDVSTKNEIKNGIVVTENNNAAAQISQAKSKREDVVLAPLQHDFLAKKVQSNEFVLLSKPEREFYFSAPQLTKPKRDFSNFALAASFSNFDNYHSKGLVAAYTFGKHLELSAGIEFGKGGKEDFRDNDDFKKRKKSDFKDKFPLPPSGNVKFTNIHTEQRKVELPILVSYKIPLYRRFTGLVGVGTNLQLYNTQNLDYQYSEGGSVPIPDNFSLKQNKAVFQNLTFSTGVQMDWKRFTLRVSPFYVMDFDKNMPDRGRTKNGGLKTQIFYNF